MLISKYVLLIDWYMNRLLYSTISVHISAILWHVKPLFAFGSFPLKLMSKSEGDVVGVFDWNFENILLWKYMFISFLTKYKWCLWGPVLKFWYCFDTAKNWFPLAISASDWLNLQKISLKLHVKKIMLFVGTINICEVLISWFGKNMAIMGSSCFW